MIRELNAIYGDRIKMDKLTIQVQKGWSLLTKPLFELGGNHISLFSLILAVAIMVASSWAAKLAEQLTRRTLKETHLDEGLKGSLEQFSRYTVLIIGFLITLDTLGVSLSSLAAIGTVLMVGVGFGLQNIAQNFISGLIILLERPIKNGDVVIVDDVAGRVTKIGARSTMIQTRDDVAIIVPNSKFISEKVINESFSGTKIRLSITVGVAYGSDTALVQETLLSIAQNHPGVITHPKPYVFFEDFGDSSLNFKLCAWVSDLWAKEITASEIRYKIDQAFREKNITIPFPQRDVHLIQTTPL